MSTPINGNKSSQVATAKAMRLSYIEQNKAKNVGKAIKLVNVKIE